MHRAAQAIQKGRTGNPNLLTRAMESLQVSGSPKRRRLTYPAMPSDGVKVKPERSAEQEAGPENMEMEMDDLWLQLKRKTEDMENHVRRLAGCDRQESVTRECDKRAGDEETRPKDEKTKETPCAMPAAEPPLLLVAEQKAPQVRRYKLAKQSGVPNIQWSTQAFAWVVTFPKVDSKGKMLSWTNRVFAVKKFMVPGRTEAEADAAALAAAKAFRAELVEKGILREPRLKDPNVTSEVPGVAWDKRKDKWKVRVPNKTKPIYGGYFTEKAAAEAKAVELREKHGLQLQVKPVPTLANRYAGLPVFHPKVPCPGVRWSVQMQKWHAQCCVGGAKKHFKMKPKDHSEAELERSFKAAVRWKKKQEKEKKGKAVNPKAKPRKDQRRPWPWAWRVTAFEAEARSGHGEGVGASSCELRSAVGPIERDAAARVSGLSSMGEFLSEVSVSELPKVEALGIELRQTSGYAAPVNVQTGELIREPFRVKHELGPDVQKNIQTIAGTLQKLKKHFGWNKVIGCSVTKAVMESLIEESNENYYTRRAKVETILRQSLAKRSQMAFFHSDIHTVGAGYHELVWGDSRSKDVWRKKTVLVCTLGRNIGAILFMDGRRESPWIEEIFRHLPTEDAGEYKFVPPTPGSEGFDEWVETLDGYLAEITNSLPSGIDRMVLVPTGRMARTSVILASDQLAKTRQLVADRGADLVVAETESEANIIRGTALDAIFELQVNQAQRALDGAIFDQMDVDGDGRLEPQEINRALTLLGIDRDLERLLEELDTTRDGVVSFDEFLAWWRKNIMEALWKNSEVDSDGSPPSARCVVTTSAKAWQSIVTNVNPPMNFGPLVLLKVTFTFCRSCRAFEPKWRKYSDQYKDIRFVELVGNGTVGAMEFCTQELGVKASPAFFVFRRGTDGGQLVMSWTGASVEKFETNLNTCIEQEAERQACDA
eukprot:s1289_g15.t1